jgi:ABC-type transport system substrate-binding protein
VFSETASRRVIASFTFSAVGRDFPPMRSVRRFSVALSAVVLTACVDRASPTSRDVRPFTIGIPDTLVSLEPDGPLFVDTQLVLGLMFEGLTRLDSAGQAAPALASRWTTADQRVWTFTIRSGATYHDGRPVQAADVVRSWRASQHPITEVTEWEQVAREVGGVSSRNRSAVTVVDSLTLRVALTRPYPRLPVLLANSEFWVRSPTSTPVAPIGTAPWRWHRGARGDSLLVFLRTPRAPGMPDTLHVRVRNAQSLGDQLGANGEIDWMLVIGSPLYSQLAVRSDVQLRSGDPNELRFLRITRRRPALRDVRIRRAIAHAIDRRALMSTQSRMPFELPHGIEPRRWRSRDPAVPVVYDPSAARALLRAAGYDSAGTTLIIGVRSAALADSARSVSWAIRNYLRASGMAADIRVVHDSLSRRIIDDPLVDLDVELVYDDAPDEMTVAGLSFMAFETDRDTDADWTRTRRWLRSFDLLYRDAPSARRSEAVAALGDSIDAFIPSIRLWWQPTPVGCSLRVSSCQPQWLGNRFESVRIVER